MRRSLTAVARIVALALMASMAAARLGSAQSPATGEYQVKAAYLYNFGRFVQWPTGADDDASFGICVLGHDPFGAILDSTLSGLVIDGKSVSARRITTAQDIDNCRIVFISASEAPQLTETLALLEKAGVLTVSDIPQFAQRGGAIQFVRSANKVRFEINLTAAQGAGLVVSSNLLKVAIAVRKNPSAGD